jgi:hypothetical protein
VTVAEAAQHLGITKEAVRKRIHRGTLHSDRDEDGTVRVYVPPSTMPSGTTSPDRDLLYQEMQARIAYLERQVEEEREARRRADTLLARLMDNLPALEPAQDSTQEPSEAAQQPAEAATIPAQGQDTTGDTGESRGSSEPWWRRWFGG